VRLTGTGTATALMVLQRGSGGARAMGTEWMDGRQGWDGMGPDRVRLLTVPYRRRPEMPAMFLPRASGLYLYLSFTSSADVFA